ncbi:MAG: hypothetical protein AAF292_10295 [Pseudomonadota bacterium]
MKEPSLAEDVAFARAMAEEGATAPTLSGRFTVMWSALAGSAFAVHWGILRDVLPFEVETIAFLWLSVMIVGGVGTALLCMTLRDKPGLSTAGNKAEAAGWPIVSVAIFGIAVAIAISVNFRDQSPILFDMIIPIAFAFYALMTALSARLFGKSSANWLVLVSLALSFVTTALVGLPEIYLLAAAGIVTTQLIPGYAALRAEPKAIV